MYCYLNILKLFIINQLIMCYFDSKKSIDILALHVSLHANPRSLSILCFRHLIKSVKCKFVNIATVCVAKVCS